jgi:hypothetical protein
MNFKLILLSVLTFTVFLSCKKADKTSDTSPTEEVKLIRGYDTYQLTTDMSKLSDNEKKMIPILIDACDIMNELFWYESFGDLAARKELMANITDEEDKQFININYGPWDRLDGNKSFIEGIEDKPAGANFYPTDMTKEEFEKADIDDKSSLYTFIRRNDAGELYSIPYHKMFPEQVSKASELLKQASELADDAGLKNYLQLRSQALLTDDYQPSDMAWLDMKTNKIDVVIGPIENYEDHLFGYKAAHEGYVLIKDMDWSKKLEKFGAFLPELQKGLPVPAEYKAEEPGRDTELNAYDVVYYAGDCNAGSKTIAINLPNDEEVQLAKGTRRLQLKNAMRAKYDKVLLPIADELIVPEQRKKINFDAFFTNTMFHEVAHGLGIKNTINGKGMVRKALKELSSGLEEGKADMLGLYMVKQLHNKGEISGNLEDYYITFATSIFRSIRFGAASAHGKANMIRFNYFVEQGAINRNEKGQYSIDFEKFEKAMQMLSEKILTLQGDGDYDGVAELVEKYGVIHPELQSDLDMLAENEIPVDLIFDQGKEVLGL